MTNSNLNSVAGFSQINLLEAQQVSSRQMDSNQSPDFSRTQIKESAEASKRQNMPPMLTHYLEYKEKYSECIIFFQVGDFYEVFFEDAILVAKAINITLTSRDKSAEQPIPMCGVPVAALDGYLDRLVDQGYSAAVVSQQNTASVSRLPAAYKEENSTSKLVINRQLSRIVTPAIRLLSENQSNKDSSIILAVHVSGSSSVQIEQASIAYCEAQTAKVYTNVLLSESELIEEITKVNPTELILPVSINTNKLDGRSAIVRKLQSRIAGLVVKYRDLQDSDLRQLEQINAYQALDNDCKKAARRLINYIDQTTNGAKITFSSFETEIASQPLQISSTTRNNLELLASPTAGIQSSVLFDLNTCKTAAGSRLFRSWLLRPLTDRSKIEARYDLIDFLISDYQICSDLRKALELCPDLERIASRIELNCVSPRELGALRDLLRDLNRSEACQVLFHKADSYELLKEICTALKIDALLFKELESRLEQQLPAQLGDAYVIRCGYSDQLDQYRVTHKQGKSWVQEFELKEQSDTGLNNLKVKFNYVLGFFIEVTKGNAGKVPEHYEKRQSTVNAERFVTKELKDKEKFVLTAEENALVLERELYQNLKKDLLQYCSVLRACGQAISQLDVILSLADTAARRSFVRPVLTEDQQFVLEQGKHPVVETALGSSFVPNSLSLNPGKSALILTGPNMGGKSTFLRQAGILTIMAQMGSFVPAKSFKLGIVDQIFARIGASDNIAGGESTFMVEMKEVVQIVSASTKKSLILIDEVGRGTSTKDGEALAQAIVEWIVANKSCRMLFATHFHSLTELSDSYPQLANISVQANEYKGEIIFTHKIVNGPAGQSYGLEVAKLAGLPREIVNRGRELVLKKLNFPVSCNPQAQQLSESPQDLLETEIIQEIETIDMNNLSPLQALNLLNKLQTKLKSGNA